MFTDSINKAIGKGDTLAATAKFMHEVRPDIWATSLDALEFILNTEDDFKEENTTFFSTAGFTFRKEDDEIIISLDVAHLYADGDSHSFLTADYRDLFNI